MATGIIAAPDGKSAADFHVWTFRVTVDGAHGTLTPGVVSKIREALEGAL